VFWTLDENCRNIFVCKTTVIKTVFYLHSSACRFTLHDVCEMLFIQIQAGLSDSKVIIRTIINITYFNMIAYINLN